MKILLADGNWFLHRAWSTLGQRSSIPTVRVPHLLLTWFCSYALRLNCSGGALCFDGPNNFRYKIYADYKAGRSGKSEDGEESIHDLVYQSMEPTFALFQQARIEVIQKEGLEADDLLRSGGYSLSRDGHQVVLVSKDKDIRQGINDNVKVFVPEMGSGPKARPAETWDKKFLFEQTGFTPRQYLDYQILIGDGMDNVPGVLGKAAAKKLLLQYGSLKKYSATKEGKKFVADNYDALYITQQMVTLRKDAWDSGPCKFRLTSNVDNKAFTELKNKLSKVSLF